MVRLLAQQNGHNGSTSGVVPPIPITIVIHSILPVYQENGATNQKQIQSDLGSRADPIWWKIFHLLGMS